MRDAVIRTCTRTGCRWPAVASLSYRYASRQVWLLDLSDPDPSLYDLCPHHADNLTVPRGWERVDQRTPSEPMMELSLADREAVPAPPPVGNRYAALAADLPRLAREHAEREAAEPVPSRELAPLPADPPGAAGPGGVVVRMDAGSRRR